MSQGLNVHHTGRACCIFVPSLRNEPVVARGESSTTDSQNRKENDAWWLLPHQMISHTLIWWLEGHSRPADSRANLPSCSSSVFPSCLTIKRPELRVSRLPGTGQTCMHVVFVLKKKHWQQRILVPKTFFPLFLDGNFHSVPHQLMNWKFHFFKKGSEEQNCVWC